MFNDVQVAPDGPEGKPPLPLQPQQQALLFALVASKHPLTVDRMRDLLWPPEAQPRDRKRPIKVVSQLKRMLGKRIRSAGPAGYGFCAGHADIVDLHGWRAIVEDAGRISSADPRAAAEMYSEALRRWTALPEAILPETDAMRELVDGLEDERLQAVERLAKVLRKLGRHAETADNARELVRAWPEREDLVEMLMLALHRAQRPVEALAVYDDHCTFLKEGVGAVPSARLREARERIRTGDAALVPAPPPPLGQADQAVIDFGGPLDIVTQPSMALYMVEIALRTHIPVPMPYHTAKNRAGVRSVLAVAPEIEELQKESVDLVARLADKLANQGIDQFIEFGALPPAPRVLHEVVRLSTEDARVLYFNIDAGLVRFSQHVLADVPDVECRWGTLATFLRDPGRMIDLARPVGVINVHEVNQTPHGQEYRALYAQLGAVLASGSYLVLTSGASEGLSSAIPWILQGAFRSAPEQTLVTRTTGQLRSLIPPGFTILAPGATHTWKVWEEWADQSTWRRDLDGPLPTISVVAVKD